MRHLYVFLFTCLFTTGLSAQKDTEWTLERAVEYALANNLQVKRLDNFADIARLNLKQATNDRLPTASGSTNIGGQFGRTIDPTTNGFNAQSIGFQAFNLQAGITLYNGGRVKNSLRQAEVDLAAAEIDSKVTANNIGLQVANGYLNIVLLREQLANSRAQLRLTADQLANTDALIKAGALPSAQRFDLIAQRAANESTIVGLENQVEMAVLTLRILLELDSAKDFDVATPALNINDNQLLESYALEEVYTAARNTQPTVLAAELRRESAETAIEIAKSGLRPTVSLFGSLSTNYSTAGKQLDQSNESKAIVPVLGAFVDGMAGRLSQEIIIGSRIINRPYFNQLGTNFGQSIGMSLNVPIYSQGRNKTNIQRAEVQRLNAQLDIQQADNQLLNDVQFALTNLRGARESYRAAQTSQEAAQTAADNAQRRFKAGAANSLDLVTATNRLEQAQTEFTRSKYQLIFNRQVIRFYLGQGLSLE